jgi:alanyl-tRNA synthetase
MKAEEIIEVEDMVNEVIGQEREVSNAVVPLNDAMKINGLRAMFGETYPDPVRVVSVGPSVTDVMADTSSASWLESSIEFCGGTHISNTKEAVAFVITEESAVAKGIRRVQGFTGQLAVEAQARAVDLASEIDSFLRILQSGDEGTAALDAQLNEMRVRLEESAISQGVKAQLRSRLDSGQKDLAALKNKELIAMVDKGVASAKEEAKSLVSAGKTAAVLKMNIGSDSKAVKRAVAEINKEVPSLSFLAVTSDEDKVTLVAYVTDEAQKDGLKANEWLSSILKPLGGRGGGKAGMAQGSVGDISQYDLILKMGAEYPTSV